MTPYTVAISGHRHIGTAGADIVRRAIREIAPSFPRAVWLSGGAVGADQLAADELLACGARLELVLPFPIRVQGARWAPAQRRRLERLAVRAEHVEIIQDRYSPGGYHWRNKRMVERADLLVAFWCPGRPGGTASTVLEADHQGVPVVICPVP